MIRGRALPYSQLRDDLDAYLRAAGVTPRAFSHVGLVVSDVQAALKTLSEQVDPAWEGVEPVWGAAFQCHIARHVQDGCEFEYIQPVGESFLRRHLQAHGEGVQHLSFEVADIEGSLEALRTAGAEMADPDVHAGLHGKVAFVRPGAFGDLCLELCQIVH
jgi:catechol 2,3-dioxygenase-like lactoylglutathione lyase family enzyme